MTGYESKRAAAQDKLAQPAQEPVFVTYKEVADTMNMLWRGKPKQVAIAIEMENMRLYTTPPQPAPVDIASLVEGMEVSIDVSTGEHDYGNRLFGTVTLVQESQYGKHGLILLVQNPEANFETPQPAQKPVAHCEAGPEYCVQCKLEDRSIVLAAAVRYVKNNTPPLVSDEICRALATPPQPAQEPVAWCSQCGHKCPLPPQRPWVGLTEQEFQLIYDMGRTPSGMMEMVESMLEDKNT